jgi:chemotaxis receptor (MCP) glutamine deamidase CheD
MQQESQSVTSSDPVATNTLPAASVVEPVFRREKCQILAKKGFLVARNMTGGLVLLVYSKEFQLGVLLQLPLPASQGGPGSPDADSQGRAFAKSAIAMILAEFESLGVVRKELMTYVIGGSATDDLPEVQKLAVQRTLWGYGLSLSACDLGGEQVRSVWMDVASGRTIIRSHSMTASLMTDGSLATQSPLPVAS